MLCSLGWLSPASAVSFPLCAVGPAAPVWFEAGPGRAAAAGSDQQTAAQGHRCGRQAPQTLLPWRGEADPHVALKTANGLCSWLLANTVETETTRDYLAREEVVTSPVSQKGKVRVTLGHAPALGVRNPHQGSGLELRPPHQGQGSLGLHSPQQQGLGSDCLW